MNLSMKVLLISAGAVALAVRLRFSVPTAVNGIPAIWSVVLSWLKPPYLYLVINGIIITIAASSRFHQSKPEPPAVLSEHLVLVKAPPPQSFESFPAPTEISTILEEPIAAAEVDMVVELRPVMVNGLKADIEPEEEETVIEAGEDRDVFVDSTFIYNNVTPPPAEEITLSTEVEITPPDIQFESLLPVREKPLVTSRFGHRKPNRTNPEGVRALRVARAKKHETLESTWKMITEGRHVPLTRHLKKQDTLEQVHVDHVPESEMLDEFGNHTQPPRIRKEPSPGQEELNRRVEAFIKKINEEMRIQRQESLNQYMEMINRGV